MTPALLIKTSIFSTLAFISVEASRTEARLLRSRQTNFVFTCGFMELIRAMTGWTLSAERPARMSRKGDAVARDVAVSAPMPPSLAPVIRTASD